MLDDDKLELLIQPIIKRQEDINIWVLNRIALRVNEIGKLNISDVHKLRQMYLNGSDTRRINEYLATMTRLQVKDIKKLIQVVALDSYIEAKPFYDYRHKSFIPYKENYTVQKTVKAIENLTVKSYKNLSRSQAFMIRDLKNPKVLKPTIISQTYQTVIDEAIQSMVSGVVDYNTAMRRTMKQLIDSGIRSVSYNTESGRIYTQRLDTAVRRNLLNAVRDITQEVQNEIGKDFGADGVELSAHSLSAPDHEPIQGHQLYFKEFEKMQNGESFKDVNGKNFNGFERPIGAYNCRHVAWNIIVGVAKPNYTEKQLESFIQANHKGYTLSNGQHLTMYECVQEQHRMETEIRHNKEGQIIALQSGDLELAKQYQRKLNQNLTNYKSFSYKVGLAPSAERIEVDGYKKLKNV